MSPRSPTRSTAHALALVVVVLLTYVNSLGNPFVLDDEGSILGNQQIRALSSLDVLRPEHELQVAGRPLVNVTLALNYAVGGLNPAGYHIVNIAVHALCALLLFALARQLLVRAGMASTPQAAGPVAFAVALIWAVHPLNSEPVDYLTQRTESLMGLFYLLTLVAATHAARARSARWSAVAIVACGLGMACKESMATAPVMVALVDGVFLFDSFPEAWRRRWRLYLGLAATWIVLAVLLATGPRTGSAGYSVGVPVWTYLLNQAPIVTRYLWLVIWPRALATDYGWPIALRLADVWPSALFITSLVVLTLILLVRRPRIGFLGAWFFITLAPASSFVPIATEAGAERRMYLPDAAVIAAGILVAVWGWRRMAGVLPAGWRTARSARTAAAITLIATASALAIRTIDRNRDYRTLLTIARATLDHYPTPTAHHTMAEYLLDAGRREEAMQELRLAVPGAPRAHYTLGLELYKDGRLDEAIAELKTFIAEQPNVVWVIAAHGYLGDAYAAKGDLPSAIEQFREVLTLTPDNSAAEHSLAEVLIMAQQFSEAAIHYQRYLTDNPKDTLAMNQLGVALGACGRLREAVNTLERAASLDPRNGAVQHNLALAFLQLGNVGDALVHARQDVALQPSDPDSQQLLQTLLAVVRTRGGINR